MLPFVPAFPDGNCVFEHGQFVEHNDVENKFEERAGAENEFDVQADAENKLEEQPSADEKFQEQADEEEKIEEHVIVKNKFDEQADTNEMNDMVDIDDKSDKYFMVGMDDKSDTNVKYDIDDTQDMVDKASRGDRNASNVKTGTDDTHAVDPNYAGKLADTIVVDNSVSPEGLTEDNQLLLEALRSLIQDRLGVG